MRRTRFGTQPDHIAVDTEGSVYLAERFRRIDVIAAGSTSVGTTRG
jgi:hypothetical protein